MKQAVQGAGSMVSKSLTHVPEVGVQVWVETVAAYCADPWVGTGICLWDYRTSDLYAYTQTWHRQERGKEERERVWEKFCISKKQNLFLQEVTWPRPAIS